MKRLSPGVALTVAAAFVAGFFTYFLYLRWNPPPVDGSAAVSGTMSTGFHSPGIEPRSHPVKLVPPEPLREKLPDPPLLQARDVEKIRGMAGRRARIRGRIFRVGHSPKSNTYFLNFGPSREALTAVIFASAVELFDNNKLSPKGFEGKEVEMEGEIKDHPQYGLELILENPSQIKLVH